MMLREVVRSQICGKTKHDCNALAGSIDPDSGFVPCEICETAFCCPKYGAELRWTKTSTMFLFVDAKVVRE